jgi:hypothetical protein
MAQSVYLDCRELCKFKRTIGLGGYAGQSFRAKKEQHQHQMLQMQGAMILHRDLLVQQGL